MSKLSWLKARLSEPSTYAGIAAGAAGVAALAQQAQGVATTFKDMGPTAGIIALITAAAAIAKSEETRKKKDTVVDAEFSEVKDKE